MKRLFYYVFFLCLVSCSTTIQLACNEPDIQIVIDDVNYGTPPVIYNIPHGVSYIDVTFVRNSVAIHQERVYLRNEQTYYEIDLPKGLKKSQSVTKFHSSY